MSEQTKHMDSYQVKEFALNDCCTSAWLKHALLTIDKRDLFDAVSDVIYIKKYLRQKLEEYNMPEDLFKDL